MARKTPGDATPEDRCGGCSVSARQMGDINFTDKLMTEERFVAKALNARGNRELRYYVNGPASLESNWAVCDP